MTRGLLVTFEGPEGSGKSTQAELLAQALPEGRSLLVREPGGTELGEKVRELLLHQEAMSAEAEMLLFMAARAELIERRIRPALEAGRTVIADRYHDSTMAYQGGVRGAEAFWPRSFPKPDLTVLLMVPAELGLERHRLAGRAADRLESEPLEFHRAVLRSYERLAGAEPARFLRLDGTLPPADLAARVLARVREAAASGREMGGLARSSS